MKKKRIPKHTKWAMSYEDRIRGYEAEKNELFYQIAGMSADEIQKARRELVEKWGV